MIEMHKEILDGTNNGGPQQQIHVVVDSASNLRFTGPDGGDVYAKFHHRGAEYKTQVQRRTNSPVWKETFVIQYKPEEDPTVLRFEIWDWERFSADKPVGQVEIDVSKLQVGSVGHQL